MRRPATDDQRHSARERMRRLRATKKVERGALQDQIRLLETTVARLRLEHRRRGFHDGDASPRHPCLHTQVMRQSKLIQLLQTWVAMQHPPEGLHERPSWLHSTLLADPVARRQGFQWLSDKVFHGATGAPPRRVDFATRLAAGDTIGFVLHTTGEHSWNDPDDDDDVMAMELHVHSIVFAPLAAVAATIWRLLHETSVATTLLTTCKMVEQVHDHLVYHHGVNPRNGMSVRRIMCRYQDTADRTVFTCVKLTHDDCFPLVDDDIRSHGFAWTVIERVTDSITVVRQSYLHFVPVTTAGALSLADLGAMFQVPPPCETDSRAAYMERLRTAAEIVFTTELETTARVSRQALATSVDEMRVGL
ncbi:Aste57867_2602 [Aphanomyces stellatus]|uniref:Aste57867_2602 protein n=1 Tax=Aphanomyces stellatus TaxID=120398 RepID=A0A485K8N3_9STRA|nr:hypothetical protein As57867_002595 [Aphanomyces stellatus]VFT79798.1 Aste57867_2602 [Aphanomyces stellatus]